MESEPYTDLLYKRGRGQARVRGWFVFLKGHEAAHGQSTTSCLEYGADEYLCSDWPYETGAAITFAVSFCRRQSLRAAHWINNELDHIFLVRGTQTG